MRTLNREQAMDVAYGACLLGSGGGGGLDMASSMINNELAEADAVPVYSVEEAAQDSDKLSCVVGFAGSPASGGHASSLAAVHALKEMDDLCRASLGKSIGYALPLEVGAVNTIVPVLAAKHLGLGVIDADGAGRAVPELTHCTYALVDGLSMNPTVMGARDGHTVTLKFVKYHRMKSILSIVLTTEPFARIGGMAIWPIPSNLLKQALPIEGVFQLCGDVGKALRGADPAQRKANALAAMAKHGRTAVELFKGTITFNQGGSEMYDTGQAVIDNGTEKAIVIIQNENLIAWSNQQQRVLGMMPDSLCYLTRDGVPLSNADAAHASGTEVSLLGVSADPELMKPGLLDAYRSTLLTTGYGGPYIPLPEA